MKITLFFLLQLRKQNMVINRKINLVYIVEKLVSDISEFFIEF